MSDTSTHQPDPAIAAFRLADQFKARVKGIQSEADLHGLSSPVHTELARLKDQQVYRQAEAQAQLDDAVRYIDAIEVAASVVRVAQLEAFTNIPTTTEEH